MGYYKKLISQFIGWLPDRYYLQVVFHLKMGTRLHLKNPMTFNEKLQWLKLYDRNPEYTTMVDKIEAKKWVAERIGEEHIIPTLGVWDNAEDIDFDSLPNQFVLKTNHDSGGIVICKDKSKLDIKQAKKKLKRSLNLDFFKVGREWPYKNVPRKIFAEKYIVDESGYELKDYKIFCFNGEPQFIQVDFDRYAETGHKRNLYTTEWDLLDFEYGYPSDHSRIISKPIILEEMLQYASILSTGHHFLRIDFYSIKHQIKIEETTIYPKAEFRKIDSIEKDHKFMQLLNKNTASIVGGG